MSKGNYQNILLLAIRKYQISPQNKRGRIATLRVASNRRLLRQSRFGGLL